MTKTAINALCAKRRCNCELQPSLVLLVEENPLKPWFINFNSNYWLSADLYAQSIRNPYLELFSTVI